MSICRKMRAGIFYIHEERSWRDPATGKVKCRTVLIGKVNRETGEDQFYPEYLEGLVGTGKGKFHSIRQLRKYRKGNPQGFKLWRMAHLARVATESAQQGNIPGAAPRTASTERNAESADNGIGQGSKSLRGADMTRRLLSLFEQLLDFASLMAELHVNSEKGNIKSQGTLWEELSRICANKFKLTDKQARE